MRILVKIVKQKVSLEKGNSIHLLTLFPGSPAKIAAKIAGLPRPTNCL
jgi:tRNA 2-thiouridine synthesizing protein E